jgi:hypothetical protein
MAARRPILAGAKILNFMTQIEKSYSGLDFSFRSQFFRKFRRHTLPNAPGRCGAIISIPSHAMIFSR